jgi:hypothetical protein
VTSVPEKAIDEQSPSVAFTSTGAMAFSTGTDSPVSTASSIVRLRGHAVAGLDQNHIAGHHLLGAHRLSDAVAQDRCVCGDHAADGVERLFGTAFLYETDRGIRHDDRKNDRCVDAVSEQRRHHRGRYQHVDQQIVELCREARECRARLRRRQPVAPVMRQPRRCFGAGQTGG